MAYQNDYGPLDAREAQERFSQGAITTKPEHGALRAWIHDIHNAAHQAAVMAGNVRAYRHAIAGPDDRLEKTPSTQAVEEPPHPSPMIQMQHAIKSLFAALNELQCEYHELEGTGLVNPESDQMF